ncbi:MAG: LPS export ABC transporter ATP-binding protein [Planctomycetes bacterium]|nr:LPS export ABC transporter ATP-binding protein [Planctomycetota bacterium]
MKLLQVDGLVKIYGRRHVVDDVSFDVSEGEIVGLLGPNGAGKTTTFLMSVGMVRPDEGSIAFLDDEITKLPMFRRARLGISYLPQERSTFRKLTVEQNILAILETLPLRRKARRERLESLLALLNLVRVRRNLAETLSGGESRRLEITRALVTEPKLILLDEPFAGIDPIHVAEMQDIVRTLRDRGIGVLLTDHNVRETLSITDRAYIIAEGHIVAHGTATELVRNPIVRKLYLGDRFDLPIAATERPDSAATTTGDASPARPRDTGITHDEGQVLH